MRRPFDWSAARCAPRARKADVGARGREASAEIAPEAAAADDRDSHAGILQSRGESAGPAPRHGADFLTGHCTGYVTLTTTLVLVAPAGAREKKTRTPVIPVPGNVIDWDNVA